MGSGQRESQLGVFFERMLSSSCNAGTVPQPHLLRLGWQQLRLLSGLLMANVLITHHTESTSSHSQNV